MVTVHRFKAYDPSTGQFVEQPHKSSAEFIHSIGGVIVRGTAEVVEASVLDPEGRYARPEIEQPLKPENGS